MKNSSIAILYSRDDAKRLNRGKVTCFRIVMAFMFSNRYQVYQTQSTYVKFYEKKVLSTAYCTILINPLGSLNMGLIILNLFSIEAYNKVNRNSLEKSN